MSVDDYDRVKVIGKGSYGEVWLAKYKTDKKQYVLKKMDLRKASKKERLAAEQEAKLLSNLKHPNIVAYKDTFEGGDGYLYIAMGYCERGDLYTRLKEQKGVPLEERQVVEWFVQIAMALQYMHERNILHRDLKTQNIFLTKNKIIKVGDLGIARVLDSSCDMATTLIGTPYYMSPELFSNKPYNFKSDVWALGCCIYEMTTLKHAFNAKDMNALMYRVLRGKLPPMPDSYRKELVDLIKAMLNKNPEKRPSVNRILRDPYIKENIAIFLEGTKSNTNLNRRPGSASKKDRPSSRDGNRPRRPKPEPQSLEPLNTGPDILEPIKEEATPRESIEVRGGLSNNLKNCAKDSANVNDAVPMEAKLEKNNSGRDGAVSSSEVLPQNPPMSGDVEKPKRLSENASKGRERRSNKNSKLSKKGIVSNASDESKVSVQDIDVFPPPNKVDQTDFGGLSPVTNEKAAVVVYEQLSADQSSNSAMTSVEKMQAPLSKRKSSSRCKPPLPESRASLSDFFSPLSEPNSPVVKSPPSDFGLAKDDPDSLMPEHRSSKTETRSTPSDAKPPVPAFTRSSANVPCPSRRESSPNASGTSSSKSRSSPSLPRSAESDARLTDKQKSDSLSRPLPPRPTSSSINPEPSRAIVYKSSKVNQVNGDSGRSSSTSSSGYSGREEAGDQLDDRASESVRRASQEMPMPMRSVESSARRRRRLQQQQQTPRISRSVDVTLCPPESFRDSGSAVTSNNSSRQEKQFRSVDCEHQNRRPGGEKKPSINRSNPRGSELEKHCSRNSSNGSGSSSEDEEESTSKAEQREEKKEIDSFINLLGTTLRLQRKSKDSDDEGDSGVEAILEIPKPTKTRNSACGATYLLQAPSPLPPGAKYPYVDESSVLISARNGRVHHRIPELEAPNLDIPERAVDPLDSAISMTTTGRLFDRISVLRKDCIHALGVEKLKIAYDILDCFDTDELEPQLVNLLGIEDFEAYAGKIFQLKFCEESAFKAQ